jgi:hypothetical protein
MNGMRRHGQGTVGCVLWSVALLVAILIAWKMIPVKIRSAELYDFMVEQAKFATGATPEVIKKRILAEADRLQLPVDKKSVTVSKRGDRIRMRCNYMVPVKFPGYTYEWTFNHEIDRPIFYF